LNPDGITKEAASKKAASFLFYQSPFLQFITPWYSFAVQAFRKMKITLIILSIIALPCFSQDLRGVWSGYLHTTDTRLAYEITIHENAETATGYSQLIYPNEGVKNVGVKKIILRKRKSEYFLEDGELVYNNFTMESRKVKLSGNLTLTKKNSQLILSGSFRTRSLDFRDSRTYKGEIYLIKQSPAEQTRILPQLEELGLLNTVTFLNNSTKKNEQKNTNESDSSLAVSELNRPVLPTPTLPQPKITDEAKKVSEERKTEIISTIGFKSDSLKFSLVDNGVIDGDTVSLILNGNFIIRNAGLSTRAISVVVPAKVALGDSLLLIMHAESLGEIPPNSGLLIIQDGNSRHEIRFQGDFQKNSGVLLRKSK
jgi:hypothetical protein